MGLPVHELRVHELRVHGTTGPRASHQIRGFGTNACLEDGCISFKMYDSYGDGWNGGYFIIETAECELATGGSDFTSGSFAEYAFTASCGDIDPCASVDCAEGYECVDGDCVLIDIYRREAACLCRAHYRREAASQCKAHIRREATSRWGAAGRRVGA